MKKVLAIIFTLLIIIAFAIIAYSWNYLSKKYPTTPPLKSISYYLEHMKKPHSKMQKETIGFLPYWRIADSRYTRQDLITEINYFGLFVNGDGEFITVYNGETNPGKREWDSQTIKDLITKTHINGNKFTLSIICQDNDDINSILDSNSSQKKLISNIINEISLRKLDGINIDFEYTGSADQKYKQKLTEFSKKLKQAMKTQNAKNKLEISILPRSARPQTPKRSDGGQARTPDIIDFEKLVPIYDNFIGMSYDFNGGSGTNAGPIAPMTGFKENKYFFDVATVYDDLEGYIPEDKIIMGVPHYGWDWAVEDGKKILSTTLLQTDETNSPAVISYARALENKDLKKSQCYFDEFALEPWCWYTDPKTKIDHQVWFENKKSIGIKYDFANKNKLGGIAIWVLGYDKDYPDLWNLMKAKFAKN